MRSPATRCGPGREQREEDLFTTSLTVAELFYEASLSPVGRRRDALVLTIRSMVLVDFSDRILAFDTPAAETYANIAATRRTRGTPMSQTDAQIAAIAKARDAFLASWNEPDFEGCGVPIINPWRR